MEFLTVEGEKKIIVYVILTSFMLLFELHIDIFPKGKENFAVFFSKYIILIFYYSKF
jgi:hypothetical protein